MKLHQQIMENVVLFDKAVVGPISAKTAAQGTAQLIQIVQLGLCCNWEPDGNKCTRLYKRKEYFYCAFKFCSTHL